VVTLDARGKQGTLGNARRGDAAEGEGPSGYMVVVYRVIYCSSGVVFLQKAVLISSCRVVAGPRRHKARSIANSAGDASGGRVRQWGGKLPSKAAISI
jgi:hypothetical protein